MKIWLRWCFEYTVAGALFFSCSDADRAPPQHVAWKAVQAVNAAQAGRLLGEDCSLGGLQCVSNLCLHYAEPDKRVCTKLCDGDADCPATWACQPSAGQSACVPRSDFQPHRVDVVEAQVP